ncbi:protein phosphatase 2C domain-containing protein [Streptomyces sp. NPDC006430]|uniref:protein phosphatase 2C domain-containing protein n=1 Tax=Streptomyces sp. NPDC006430 TaxID=3154299 RepID=UPI0033B058A9
MSQQGADDWWQKLYEDPDGGTDPDPGDTLESRFHSASVLTTPPAAPPGAPDALPPVPPPHAVLPGPRREAAPEPPPRDPREPGTTGYGLGSVTVPPALPEEPPVGRRVPQEEPPYPAAAWDASPAVADPWRTAGWQLGAGPVPRAGTEGVSPAGAGAGAGAGSPMTAGPAAGPGPGLESGFDPGPRTAPGAGPGFGPAPDAGAGQTTVDGPGGPRPWPGPVTAGGGAVGTGPWSEPGGGQRPEVRHLGDRAPTYAADPGALPVADPGALDALVPDTVLEGARHGTYTLRAASVRGDSARFRGEARRDFLLTARFGTGDDALVLAAVAGGDRAAPGAAEAAAEVCRWIAAAVGRSRERLADDIRAGRREDLRSGLQRLTDRGYGRLRARAIELGLPEDAYTAGLRVLLLPIDPECRTRVCFGAGAGGLFRLRAGQWQDLEPAGPGEEAAESFRFRAAVARPGDTLLLCSGGLADPLREEGLLSAELAARWAGAEPPGLAAFLADTQLRLKGYADDRTAAAVWEA